MRTFPIGGIHPSDNKEWSKDRAIETLELPSEVYIPMIQHIGAPSTPIVKKGDKVLTGQLIGQAVGFVSANIHSSVSGTVTSVDAYPNGQGQRRIMVVIKREGDEWVETIDRSTELKRECTLTPQEIIAKVRDAGIVGLGGAQFPTHVKLSVPDGQRAEVLIINGVECEPYLTSDYRNMMERAELILTGVEILMRAVSVERAVIGVENNKPDAIAHLSDVIAKGNYRGIEVMPLKVRYPQGGEKQLIAAVTGRQVAPPPALPISVGAVVCNVSTTIAVYEAVQKNKPLIERVVTITGQQMVQPRNLLTRMGTPISTLVEKAGGLPEGDVKVVNGGPMMGNLGDEATVVTKTTNAIIVLDESHSLIQRKNRNTAIDLKRAASSCCQCETCTNLCPRHALGHPIEPHKFMRSAANKDFQDTNVFLNTMFCSSCGLCENFLLPLPLQLLRRHRHSFR